MYSNRDLHGTYKPKSINDTGCDSAAPFDLVGQGVAQCPFDKPQISIAKPLVDEPVSARVEHIALDELVMPPRGDGPYKHTYPRKFKELVVAYAEQNSVRAACKKFSVTRKNVERWCKNGLDRKKGAGRKTTNPAMEVEILAWVEDYIRREGRLPKRNYIIIRAMQYADGAFKASKGWCDKFLKRNRCVLEQYLTAAKESDSDDT